MIKSVNYLLIPTRYRYISFTTFTFQEFTLITESKSPINLTIFTFDIIAKVID